MKRMRRKTQSKMYATDKLEILDAASISPVISISGGRDFYLTQIVIWSNVADSNLKDIRIKFEDNTTDMNWQDKPVSIESFVNRDRRLDFHRDLAHKTDVTLTISNNAGATIEIQVVFIGYEMKIRPEGDKITPGM